MTLRLLVMLLLTGCAGHRFVECNSTEACRAQFVERERQYARAVANEPGADRLEVEPVSTMVLFDRQRQQLVYALDPALVALDLRTGETRWRAAVTGDRLWRVGRLLAVTTGEKLPPKVTFIDPENWKDPVVCTLDVGAPPTAATVQLHLFDRAGQPYAYWRSQWRYSGGTRRDDKAVERELSSDACGVVRIDPRSCRSSSEPLERFVWEPPEGRWFPLGQPGACEYLTPLMDLPAAAASAPRVWWFMPLLTATSDSSLRVSRIGGGCRVSNFMLVAQSTSGEVLWSHPLERQSELCGPP